MSRWCGKARARVRLQGRRCFGWPCGPSSLRASPTKSRSRTRPPRPRVVCLFSRSVDGAAAVAASAARSLGRRHGPRPGFALKRAGRVCFVVFVAARRALVAFRLRPASRPWPSWSALRFRAARPPLWSVRASARSFPLGDAGAPVVRAPASSKRRPRPRVARGPWFRRRARAAGSCGALSACAPGFSAAGPWWTSAFGS